MMSDFKIIKLENYITLMSNYYGQENNYAPDFGQEDQRPLN